MSGIEEGALGALILGAAFALAKVGLEKLKNRTLKKKIIKNAELAFDKAKQIYTQLEEVGLSGEDLPVVSEIVEKIERITNSELGSKVQKNKIVTRLLKRLKESVGDEAILLIEDKLEKLKENEKLKEQAEKLEQMLKTLDTSNVAQTAMNLAKSFSPPEQVEITPEQQRVNKVLARNRRGRR